MTIAILYICTGKYNQFFDGFYKSAMKYLLPKYEKTFFVWTDDDNIAEGLPNVKIIHKECAGFPLDSLFRFEMFLSVEDELKKYDYIFFFNANMQIFDVVEEEFLPKKTGLTAVIHPGYYNKVTFIKPFERNKKSTACIKPYRKKYTYFMGSLNGGNATEYLSLIKECANNIKIDYEKGIIAKFHDESHLNKYLSDHQCEGLPPEFAYPEGSQLPFNPKILLLDKVRIDSYFDKGRKHTVWSKIKKGFLLFFENIRWYLKI